MVKLLIVDDESGVRNLLGNYFTDINYNVLTAATGEEALTKIDEFKPHLVFLDVGLPRKSGLQVLEEIKSKDPTIKVIMITGMDDKKVYEKARTLGASDYVKKPFKLEYLENEVLPKIGRQLYEDLRRENLEKTRLNEELAKKLNEIESLYGKLKQTSIQTIMSLALTLESKDPYTHGHSQRVSKYSRGIALALKENNHWNIDDEFLNNIERESMLHDIGKVGMPDNILRKPDKLTDEEYGIVKMHPEIGARILQPIEDLRENIEVILHHHETYDGKGYPDGLRSDKIPLRSKIISVADTFDAIVSGYDKKKFGMSESAIPERSRILSVADAYDAMTSVRSYRAALTKEEAIEEIERCKGTQFDPEVVDAFITYLEKSED
ncbi:MAG: HD domain-containing phosphohydrolase [bacterium]